MMPRISTTLVTRAEQPFVVHDRENAFADVTPRRMVSCVPPHSCPLIAIRRHQFEVSRYRRC
jgi:hypothetical protein